MDDPLARDRSIPGWIYVLSLAGVVLTWLLASPGWMTMIIKEENESIEKVFGRQASSWILEQSIEKGTGLYRKLAKNLAKRGSSKWGASRGDVARRMLIMYLQRIQNAGLVGLLMAPLIIAAALDGKTLRAIARDNQAMIRQVRYNIGIFLIGGSIILPAVFLVIPLPVHPAFMAIYWIIVALGVRTALRYYQYEL